MASKKNHNLLDQASDKLIKWIGSTNSLIVHTAVFALTLVSCWIFPITFNSVLLILTTVVSLEAIYLAILIQRSVNQQSIRLDDVEESLDDVGESLGDVEESIDDVEVSLSKKNTPAYHGKKLERDLNQIIEELKSLKGTIGK